jgi:hypothetical protein
MSRAPNRCPQKQALIAQFERAASNYLRMQSAQLMSVINGDGFQFEDEIEKAGEERDRIKDLILLHQQNHGCRG